MTETRLDEVTTGAYCYISHQMVHCVPLEEYQRGKLVDNAQLKVDVLDVFPNKLHLKKNLLYLLNNPSLSDAEHNMGICLATLLDSEIDNGDDDRESSHSLYFPKYVLNLQENLENNFVELKQLLGEVMLWQGEDEITVNRLTGGITNMLLKCSNSQGQVVLCRVYGHGTNLIIDRHREFVLQLHLNSIGLAPAVYCRFKNGVVYGFFSGRSLKPEELRNPHLYPLIAQQLGNWHNNINTRLIEVGVAKLRQFSKKKEQKKKLKKRFISNVYELIDEWIKIIPVSPSLVELFATHLPDQEVTAENIKQVVSDEFKWLTGVLLKHKSPVVLCHSDLLLGNIIIPDNYTVPTPDTPVEPLPPIKSNFIKFIDYEYMLPAPRAFDIANHLAEWQGFDCDREAIPVPSKLNMVMRKFVEGYLQGKGTQADVDGIIDEIQAFYGLPGFYWGIWAMIQQEISNIDFDYDKYGAQRLGEYWTWKEMFWGNRTSNGT